MAAAGTLTSLGTIGTEVGEAVFADEPVDYGRQTPQVTTSSPYDLFADESAAPLWAAVPPDPTPEHAAMGSGHEPETLPTARRTSVRPSLLAILSLVAAVVAFLTVRACQMRGGSPMALWRLLGF